ncbi:4'-phosphopantetheinyl transferase family protein [Streptomyces poriticola]|uniref:4'-phosphopantetheinyl transferase family protein n=1 Tax=Streptomyces poriticola TaxID=3120506 RepID=UPI002FCE01CD
MIVDLVPPGVELCEAYGDRGPEAAISLFPAEQALLEGVSGERRREFTTVRGCARRALERLEIPAEPLVPDVSGAPRWPRGAVGSLTHCPGYRAALVARAGEFAGLGLDAEPAEPLPPAVAARILPDAERRRPGMPALLRGHPGVPPDRLVFCAKEASYKAFSPWLGRRHGFREFVVRPRADGWFDGELPEGAGAFRGRWALRSGYVVAAVCLAVREWSEPAVPVGSGWQQAVI